MKTFGEMTWEEKEELLKHYYEDGGEIESHGHYGWGVVWPAWEKNKVYRKEVTKPSINWDHVSEEWNYLCCTISGLCLLFTNKPIIRSGVWYSPIPNSISASGFASLKKGTCDWKDSLVARPGYE